MRVLGKDDAVRLGELLKARWSRWSEWECKFYRDNIIIYIPVTPWNPKTRRSDPSMRYMAKHWRVVPEPGGPFRLEYMRHTGQWWPAFEAIGNLEKIAKLIEREAKTLRFIDSGDA
jgi:hypothetical protein